MNNSQTPDVIRFFAKKQPGNLRQRLLEIDRDEKIGKVDASVAERKRLEVLSALRKMDGVELSSSEAEYLKRCGPRS